MTDNIQRRAFLAVAATAPVCTSGGHASMDALYDSAKSLATDETVLVVPVGNLDVTVNGVHLPREGMLMPRSALGSGTVFRFDEECEVPLLEIHDAPKEKE